MAYLLSENDVKLLKNVVCRWQSGEFERKFYRRRAAPTYAVGKVTWAKVINGLKYADPEGDPPEGYSEYTVRLLTMQYEKWAEGVNYEKDEELTRNDYLYRAKFNHVSTALNGPTGTPESNGFWQWVETEVQVSGIAMEGDYLSVDLRNWVRWFVEDDIIPLTKRSGNYYIWQTLIPAGSSGFMSVRWHETENRIMAVYK
ncbi:MAG TPA: hypothetical protein HPP87_04705 [Planctomycetes bacterium]|nr:hypothetical protein [Planctomycetota bacterium]